MQKCLMLATLIFLALCGHAHADPCEAPVGSYKAGQTFAGTVAYVVDGDGICVAAGATQRGWVEVRLADFYAPEISTPAGKAAAREMRKIAFGRDVICTVQRGSNGRTYTYDRVIAVCRIDGQSVGDALRRAGVKEGGNGRR
jgi:endonuclease YncB( thermonuclease family)